MTLRIWSCIDNLLVILVWNNCLDILNLAVLFYSPYNSLRLRSMDWLSILLCCLCNSLFIEANMIYLIVASSYMWIPPPQWHHPQPLVVQGYQEYKRASPEWVQSLNFSINSHNWIRSTCWNLKFLVMIMKMLFVEFNL